MRLPRQESSQRTAPGVGPTRTEGPVVAAVSPERTGRPPRQPRSRRSWSSSKSPPTPLPRWRRHRRANMRPSLGISPLSSIRPAFFVTAISVPSVSKKSTKRKTNTISSRPRAKASRTSSWKAAAVIAAQSSVPGRHSLMPVADCHSRRAPRSRSAPPPGHSTSAARRSRASPPTASSTLGSERSPRVTSVAGSPRIMPAFFSPNQRQKQADARRHRSVELPRHRHHQALANSRHGQRQKDQP